MLWNHELWPRDQATQKAYLRFDWKNNMNSSLNKPGIKEVFTYLRGMGEKRFPEAKKVLAQISNDDLMDRIHAKYTYMSSEWKKVKKANEAAEERQKHEEEMEELNGEDEEDRKVLNRSQKNSQAEAVLSARIQKRPQSQYTDAKFDSAFILNAMSDYEDDPEQSTTTPTCFVQRAPC
ncbi:hypothetical protein BD779DRAFT_1684714 [Infundibulicybe gibba]|nr:hypothetical protein BD779DRAFT_1684714 [Infundibulicybe gibba]